MYNSPTFAVIVSRELTRQLSTLMKLGTCDCHGQQDSLRTAATSEWMAAL